MDFPTHELNSTSREALKNHQLSTIHFLEPMLTLFTQPSTLQSIGHNRITRLLFGFTDDLRAANLPALLVEHQNGNYVDHLAAFLADHSRLPERLRNTLLTLENAASETNHEALESIIQRCLGGATLTGLPLDRALEVWFSAPEELSQFQPPNPNPDLNLLPDSQPGGEARTETPHTQSEQKPEESESSHPQPLPSQIENQKSETCSPERGFSTRSNDEPAIAPGAQNTTNEQ